MTSKQHRYIVVLLGKLGWGTKYMGDRWRSLGFTGRECAGAVSQMSGDMAARAIRGLELLLAEREGAPVPRALRSKDRR